MRARNERYIKNRVGRIGSCATYDSYGRTILNPEWIAVDGDYYCDCCDEIVGAELREDSSTGYRELRCASCGELDVEEAPHCQICGEPMSPYEDSGVEYVCETCVENLDYSIAKAIEIFRHGTKLSYKVAKQYIKERLEMDDDI